MKVRTGLVAALTAALLATLLPAAHAATEGEFRPVEQVSDETIAAVLQNLTQADADVVGGKPAAPGEHPYVGVVLLIDPATGNIEGLCSGSLIRPRYALTAGHCTAIARAALFIPDVTDVADITPADVYQTAAVATSPRYKERTAEYDAGLLRLSRPARGITPVTVAGAADNEHYLGGTKARVAGWGAFDYRLIPTRRLRKATIELLSTDGCDAAWKAGEYRHASMICGGGQRTDTCIGDSGGPLLVRDADDRWLLLGLTSFGKTACYPTPDAVYARASSVRGWIERVTGLAPRPGDPTFRDVSPSERHFESILTIVDEGIANGLADGTYRPDRAVTRGQMASFLERALDLEASGPPPFTDVDPGYVHAEAIAAVTEAGIAQGDDGAYRPGAPLTRAQMATFLTRALGLPDAPRLPFSDVRPGSVHADAIAAVAKAGITTGFADGTFRPGQKVTRAQMAGFLARALDLQVLEPSI